MLAPEDAVNCSQYIPYKKEVPMKSLKDAQRHFQQLRILETQLINTESI